MCFILILKSTLCSSKTLKKNFKTILEKKITINFSFNTNKKKSFNKLKI